MAQHGRYFRPKDPSLKGTGYDSKLEKRLHEDALVDAIHHPNPIPYYINHKYNPDFLLYTEDKNSILIEAKGYFQDRKDSGKYIWIKKCLAQNEELVFIFENPNKPIHFQSKRKDGTKMTHGEWCIKHGFRYFSEDNICLTQLLNPES